MAERAPRPHHRPMLRNGTFFAEHGDTHDPALTTEVAERSARLLVRGARASTDAAVAERLVTLAETEGLDELAELWSTAASDTLAGSLWRLYLLRSWVHADPRGAAEEFEAGRHDAEVARVLSGVAEPPGPEQLLAMVDAVLRGIAVDDYADVLLRAAAFAEVVATGRSVLHELGSDTVERMLTLAEQLARAAELERLDHLG